MEEKKEDTKIPATIQTSGKVQSKANTANTFRAPSSMTMWAWSAYKRMWVWFCVHAIHASNKNFILNVGMEKILKQDLGWRVSVLPNPALHCILCIMQQIMAHSGGMQEWVIKIPSIPILVSALFPSLHLEYNFVNSLYCFHAHAHKTTLTSVFKLSHTHTIVPESVGCVCFVCTFPVFS